MVGCNQRLLKRAKKQKNTNLTLGKKKQSVYIDQGMTEIIGLMGKDFKILK